MERITFYAYGHPNVTATHRTTLEITKDHHLTPKGTCIIAIKSDYACADLPQNIREMVRKDGTKVIIILEIDGLREKIVGYGDNKLKLSSNNSIVIRKSNYIDDRTLAIKADKAAKDIDRNMIKRLTDPKKRLKITIETISI